MSKAYFQVHGKPFIALAGEAHNSNAATIEAMEEVWESAERLGLNTILIPVTWEMVETEEGSFDFTVQDQIIEKAREKDLHIYFLWFGSFKNAQCMYAPAWVKKDLKRFPRAEVEKGKYKCNLKDFYDMPYTSLSYLGEETKKADANAFATFMKHLKNLDQIEQTVIGIQVENETGLMGAAREHSDLADQLFAGNVPSEFLEYMKNNTIGMSEDIKSEIRSGKGTTWSEAFGEAAEEIFSAYYVSKYVETVANAGKKEYELPMSVNCWLDKGEPAGKYPSGGPVARVMEVWKYMAPSIDIFAPDIYVQDFMGTCESYMKLDNPLFIPETAVHAYAGERLVYAVGNYHAMCFAPFGFEDMGKPFTDTQGFLFGMDTQDPMLQIPQNEKEYCWYNHTLHSLIPFLTENYHTNRLQAACVEKAGTSQMIFDKYGFTVVFDSPLTTRKDGVCLINQVDEESFFIVINGGMLIPFSTDPEKQNVDILSLDEGEVQDGTWKVIKRINGDEVQIMKYDKPTLLRIRLFAYGNK